MRIAILDYKEVTVYEKDELRFARIRRGVRYVTMAGILMMLQLLADN